MHDVSCLWMRIIFWLRIVFWVRFQPMKISWSNSQHLHLGRWIIRWGVGGGVLGGVYLFMTSNGVGPPENVFFTSGFLQKELVDGFSFIQKSSSGNIGDNFQILKDQKSWEICFIFLYVNPSQTHKIKSFIYNIDPKLRKFLLLCYENIKSL